MATGMVLPRRMTSTVPCGAAHTGFSMLVVLGSSQSSPSPIPMVVSLTAWAFLACACKTGMCPHLFLLTLTPCESAVAAKLREQIRNAKNF